MFTSATPLGIQIVSGSFVNVHCTPLCWLEAFFRASCHSILQPGTFDIKQAQTSIANPHLLEH